MAGAVEAIERIDEAVAEERLDLCRPARLQEREEAAEGLQIATPRGQPDPALHQLRDDPIDIALGDLPRRPPSQLEEPLEHARAVLDRALREPLRRLAPHERIDTLALEHLRIAPSINRSLTLPNPPTFPLLEQFRQRLTNTPCTFKTMPSPGQQEERCFPALSAHRERVPRPIEWTKVFPDPRLAKAVIDRLTHRAHIIDTGTESWRFRHGLPRRDRRPTKETA